MAWPDCEVARQLVTFIHQEVSSLPLFSIAGSKTFAEKSSVKYKTNSRNSKVRINSFLNSNTVSQFFQCSSVSNRRSFIAQLTNCNNFFSPPFLYPCRSKRARSLVLRPSLRSFLAPTVKPMTPTIP
jgi:hypothetical protein